MQESTYEKTQKYKEDKFIKLVIQCVETLNFSEMSKVLPWPGWPCTGQHKSHRKMSSASYAIDVAVVILRFGVEFNYNLICLSSKQQAIKIWSASGIYAWFWSASWNTFGCLNAVHDHIHKSTTICHWQGIYNQVSTWIVWACRLWIRCAPSFMLIFLLYLDS